LASYLLQETGDKITLEDGSGFILLELSVDSVTGILTLDLDSVTVMKSIDNGNFIAIKSTNDNYVAVSSLNLESFKVKTDG
jgi:hypothetical protein